LGWYPQPGEIALSHNDVLFLDELPEYKRGVLEVMWQPLKDREVTISRARFTVTYPSSFMLGASMNPQGRAGTLMNQMLLLLLFRQKCNAI
jgi:magnesium chelatase family protein